MDRQIGGKKRANVPRVRGAPSELFTARVCVQPATVITSPCQCLPRVGAVHGTFSADSHLISLRRNGNWLTTALAVAARKGGGATGEESDTRRLRTWGMWHSPRTCAPPRSTSMNSDSEDNGQHRATFLGDSLFPYMQPRKRGHAKGDEHRIPPSGALGIPRANLAGRCSVHSAPLCRGSSADTEATGENERSKWNKGHRNCWVKGKSCDYGFIDRPPCSIKWLRANNRWSNFTQEE